MGVALVALRETWSVATDIEVGPLRIVDRYGYV